MNKKIVETCGQDKLPFNLGTQLLIEVAGTGERLKTKLVGVDPSKCLIVNTPFSQHINVYDRSFLGTKVLVRLIHQGSVIGFQSKLIGSINVPVKFLLLSYPKAIESHNLRSHPRYFCFLPAELTIEDERYRGIILDVSATGCRFLIRGTKDNPLPIVEINSRLLLEVRFPGMENKQKTFAQLKNIQYEVDEVRLGMLFLEMPEDLRVVVLQFISSIEKSFAADPDEAEDILSSMGSD